MDEFDMLECLYFESVMDAPQREYKPERGIFAVDIAASWKSALTGYICIENTL